MKIATFTPPLKWHGGKSYLADDIIALMPPHTHYVESFFGAGSVLLAKDPEGVSEVVNDLNGELTNFWKALQKDDLFELMKRRLDAVPFSINEYSLSCQGEYGKCELDRAVNFFVRCRQSMAGRMKSFAPLSRTRTRRGMNEQASAWLGAIDGLPAVHRRMKRVVVLNADAVEVIRQQDGPATLHYCDPPYPHETRKSTDVYAHEMTTTQHVGFLDTVKLCTGKVIISGYDCPLYADQLKDWTRHAFDLPNNSASGKTKRRMTEIVWCNF